MNATAGPSENLNFTSGLDMADPAPSTDGPNPVDNVTIDSLLLNTAPRKSPNERPRWAVLLEASFLTVILSIGLVCHMLVIYIFGSCCRRWKVLQVLLVGLSSIEVLTLLGFAPVHLMGTISGGNHLTPELCTGLMMVLLTGFAISNVVKVTIGLSRVVFSYSEKLYLRWFQARYVILYLSSFSVVMFVVICVPVFVGYVDVRCGSDQYRCMISAKDYTSVTVYMTCISVLVLLVPNLANVSCYTAVLLTIQKTTDLRIHVKDLTSVKLSAGLMWTNFLLCWVPFILFNIIDPTGDYLPIPLQLFGFDMFLINLAMDPFLYAFRMKELSSWMKALCKQKGLRSGPGSEDMCDFNDLGEEYDHNLEEVLRHMEEADLAGIDGIVKKQQRQKARQQFQLSVCKILQEHCKKKENQLSRSQSDKKEERTTKDKWKQIYSVVRVRDIMNLNTEDVIVPSKLPAFIKTQISM